jgi:NAD-dependent deacetylase
MAADRHDEKALELREMIARSRRAVVFTGAGISTESGIADFRSPGGMWSKYRPINFHDFMASEQMRVESWRRLAAVRPVMTGARPNKGHGAVARLVETGKVSAVITQNIDGLHQLSGVCPEKVIELHGNATYAACLECRKRYELDDILASFAETETPPACDACGGIVKTATISFGQEMPQAEMQAAQQESLACDLFISLGSSLVVYPAAAFPEIARRNGAKLAIINREPTGLDRVADLVIHAEIGETLSAAVE